MKRKLLSVVISFRNEAEVLPELITRLREACLQVVGFRSELIFINDCSTDASLDILLREQARQNDIVIVNTSRRFGVSECVIAGFEYAEGDYVIYMDADLQDPPELIPQLVAKAQNEAADVVFTTRTKRPGETRFKMLITRIGYAVLNRTATVDIPYNSGDFKLLSRRVVDQILQMKEQKPFVRGLVSWVGFKQVQLFYERAARGGGRTHFPILSKRVIYNFLDSAMISFSDAPLKVSLLFGALATFAAGAFLLWVFVQKLLGWAIPGWSAIMATILFFGGIQILLIGMLGLYINAIYLQVKGRPIYIVDRVIRGAAGAEEALD